MLANAACSLRNSAKAHRRKKSTSLQPTSAALKPGSFKSALSPADKALRGIQLLHNLRHCEGCLRGFSTTIVLPAQAAHTSLLFIIQQKHFVNHWNFISQLYLHQRLAYGFTDVRRMRGFAA